MIVGPLQPGRHAGPTFGTGGKVTTDFGGYEAATSVALQIVVGQTKLVVGGYAGTSTNQDFALARYNLNGTLDTTFDGDAKVVTAFGPGSDRIRGIAIQAGGKIVAVGDTFDGSRYKLVLARYLGACAAAPRSGPTFRSRLDGPPSLSSAWTEYRSGGRVLGRSRISEPTTTRGRWLLSC
jgi:hypothetical protein